jgi:hypothetical protein
MDESLLRGILAGWYITASGFLDGDSVARRILRTAWMYDFSKNARKKPALKIGLHSPHVIIIFNQDHCVGCFREQSWAPERPTFATFLARNTWKVAGVRNPETGSRNSAKKASWMAGCIAIDIVCPKTDRSGMSKMQRQRLSVQAISCFRKKHVWTA